MAKNLTRSNRWNWNRDENRSGYSSGNNLPAVAAFGPFAPLSSFFRDMDRLFENTIGNLPLPTLQSFRPKIDIAASDEEYTLRVEAPGMAEDDIQLSVSQDGMLTIRGEKKQQREEGEGKDFQRVESSYGFFQRTLALPEDVDCDNIEASCENGIVTITLPRLEEEEQTRQIEIQSGGGQSQQQRRGGQQRSQGQESQQSQRQQGGSYQGSGRPPESRGVQSQQGSRASSGRRT
ncbi:MAG: Hsp20/alpha crystallin family protein [Pseudomonadota bacterium]|nr:Hsp20/alpha crystallin family protein [Pseudomonadota bacterium]